MANAATVADIEARWRPLTAQETTNADALLDDAWALLLTRRPSLEADITAGTVTAANVVRVEVAMILRVMRNPDGKVSERIDDYSYTRDAAVATGGLYVSDDELGDLTPGRTRRNSVRLVVYGDA
jgi:hypothetical protein